MKIALITGGSSGLGKVLAIELAKQQIKVFIVGRDEEKLNETQALFPDLIIPLKADLAIEAERNIVAQAIDTQTDHVDYLIHNAGTEKLKSFKDLTLSEWQYAYSLNVEAVFSLTKKLLSRLRNPSRILFVSSGFAYRPMQGISTYCSSKAAFTMLAECLKIELKPQGIGVTVVLPGAIDTEMQTRLREAEILNAVSGIFFRELQPKLRSPQIVADFIKNILLNTQQDVFIDTAWDINKADEQKVKFT